jgi:hypothetical protein
MCCIAITDKANAIFLRKIICSRTVSELFSSLDQKRDIPRGILVIALFIRVYVPIKYASEEKERR